MRRFSVIVASVLSVSAFSLTFAPPAFAQDAAELEMADFQFSSVITTDNVYVRSGSSESDYPVVKLSKGDNVIAVGRKFDWVKILPPENTYCLVGKAWIEKRGDGSVGRVREESSNVNVRIASNLNNMITKVAMQLHGGSDVKILGEQDEYFKIAPPAGTFMWVHQKFVEPVKRVEVVNNNGQLEIRALDPNKPGPTPNTPKDTTGEEVASTTGQQPATQPSNTTTTTDTTSVATTDTTGPTTAPAVPVASAGEKEFDALEAKFTDASKLPLEQQPIDELLTGYEKLVAAKQVPESMLRLAEFRVKGLKIRQEALADLQETKRRRDQLASESKPLEAEGQEITQRLEEARIKQFTAVGTLRPSALPYGGRTLYRLTDPATGRTVVYVNTDDANVIKLEGMFIGLRGTVTEDPARKIKFIQPSEVEQIDPANIIKGSITSTLTPASLLPSSASTKQE